MLDDCMNEEVNSCYKCTWNYSKQSQDPFKMQNGSFKRSKVTNQKCTFRYLSRKRKVLIWKENKHTGRHGTLPSFVYKDRVECFSSKSALMQLTLPLQPLGLFTTNTWVEEVKGNSTMHRGDIWVAVQLNMEPSNKHNSSHDHVSSYPLHWPF